MRSRDLLGRLQSIPIEDRFWDKVDKSSPESCWGWLATKNNGGYGRIGTTGHKTLLAHRISYEMARGPIPAGFQIDHLCRNRACVNPAHMEIVTARQNIQRGMAGLARAAQMRAKTHCLVGHPLDLLNTYFAPDGTRHCKLCQRHHVKEWRERAKQQGQNV